MMILILSMNIMFMCMNHPMSMGLILIIQTLLMAVNSGMMMKSFWMSYILLITMLSGMLVLFIYMSSVASNEKFKKNMKMVFLSMTLILLSMLFLFLNKKMIIKNNYFWMEMMFKEEFLLSKMFSSKTMKITILMVVYLFFTMIVSTKLVNILEGPMRMKI